SRNLGRRHVLCTSPRGSADPFGKTLLHPNVAAFILGQRQAAPRSSHAENGPGEVMRTTDINWQPFEELLEYVNKSPLAFDVADETQVRSIAQLKAFFLLEDRQEDFDKLCAECGAREEDDAQDAVLLYRALTAKAFRKGDETTVYGIESAPGNALFASRRLGPWVELANADPRPIFTMTPLRGLFRSSPDGWKQITEPSVPRIGDIYVPDLARPDVRKDISEDILKIMQLMANIGLARYYNDNLSRFRIEGESSWVEVPKDANMQEWFRPRDSDWYLPKGSQVYKLVSEISDAPTRASASLDEGSRLKRSSLDNRSDPARAYRPAQIAKHRSPSSAPRINDYLETAKIRVKGVWKGGGSPVRELLWSELAKCVGKSKQISDMFKSQLGEVVEAGRVGRFERSCVGPGAVFEVGSTLAVSSRPERANGVSGYSLGIDWSVDWVFRHEPIENRNANVCRQLRNAEAGFRLTWYVMGGVVMLEPLPVLFEPLEGFCDFIRAVYGDSFALGGLVGMISGEIVVEKRPLRGLSVRIAKSQQADLVKSSLRRGGWRGSVVIG
uniref:hypothetical protein n=1 Tax=Amycolatopsis sp. cmx-4-61 TaxID=2790937 RepID=UPI00397DAB9B